MVLPQGEESLVECFLEDSGLIFGFLSCFSVAKTFETSRKRSSLLLL